MFTEMGEVGDYATMRTKFAEWLDRTIPAEIYRAWVACDDTGAVVAGCGLILIDRAPNPSNLTTHSAYVYNVFVEPEHRKQGLARRLMEEIHSWCREAQIGIVSLHASEFGEHLYETLGYKRSNEMRLRLTP
jgi:GNAT superfamily N-acetyltransferase